MNQTRLESLIETGINTAIGFAISYLAWPPIAALLGIPFSSGQHVGVVAFFTVISVARGYVVRRWFNHRLHHMAVRLAARVSGDGGSR